MKPCLDARPGVEPKHISVEEYAKDHNIWLPKGFKEGRKNPWHPDLDDIMFYL